MKQEGGETKIIVGGSYQWLTQQKDIILQSTCARSTNETIPLAPGFCEKLQTEFKTQNIFYCPSTPFRRRGSALGTGDKAQILQDDASVAFPPGPYFLSRADGSLMPAYRLHEDIYETFVQVRLRIRHMAEKCSNLQLSIL